MSRRNREKRAAKQKQRRRVGAERVRTRFGPGPDGVPPQELLVLALRDAAMCCEHDAEWHATDLRNKFPASAHDLDLVAETAVADAVRAAWEAGWMPSDLHDLARRRLEPSRAEYLAEAIILESKRYAVATLHPRWRADLAVISTGIDPNTQTPQMGRWAVSRGVDRCATLAVVLEVLALLGTLPALEPLLPCQARAGTPPSRRAMSTRRPSAGCGPCWPRPRPRSFPRRRKRFRPRRRS